MTVRSALTENEVRYQNAAMADENKRLRVALRNIANYPPHKEFERDERGEIKNGAMAWGPGGALHQVQRIAIAALAVGECQNSKDK